MLSNLIGRTVTFNINGRSGTISLITEGKNGTLFYILMANGDLEVKYHADFRVKD